MLKNIVITGASTGLGKAMAIQAAKRGANVALLARSADKLKTIADEIKQIGVNALPVPTDVSDESQVVAAFEVIRDEWGAVDVLINNAGVIQPIAPLHEVDAAQLETLLKINVFGSFIATREALKMMRSQKKGGVVNISSGAAYKPYPGWSAYGSSKAALDMMTRIAAVENRDANICIFGIAPGVFESNMQQTIRQTPPDKFPLLQRFIEMHEKGYLADPADVGDLIVQIAINAWADLNGMISDIRDPELQKACLERGIKIPSALKA
jgi:NAD(P)-dependent dehydrogenase (short-subunit alcohol dehydrogenase family)